MDIADGLHTVWSLHSRDGDRLERKAFINEQDAFGQGESHGCKRGGVIENGGAPCRSHGQNLLM